MMIERSFTPPRHAADAAAPCAYVDYAIFLPPSCRLMRRIHCRLLMPLRRPPRYDGHVTLLLCAYAAIFDYAAA